VKCAGFTIGFSGVFLALLAEIILVAGRDTPFAQVLAAISIMVVIAHTMLAFGRVEAAAFVVICLVVTFSVESIGTSTGIPFGHYAFLVGPNFPHVGLIPLIVGPLYVGMGYPSWVIANLILNGMVHRPASRLELVALPVIAAFVMVQWDVVMDPGGSTLARAWVWYDGGGFFGVPLSNFLGWFVVTYIYFQAFSLFAFLRRSRPDHPNRSFWFWAVPVLLYLAAGLCHIPPLFDADAQLVDGAHRVWSAAALRETAAIVMLFTMLPSALLALLRLGRARADNFRAD